MGLRPKLILFLAGVAVMGALLALVRAGQVFPGDEWPLLEMRQWRAGWLDITIGIIYMVALANYVIPYLPIFVVVMVALLRHWGDGLLLATCGILAPVLNLALKELATRARPDAALALVDESGYSFPSGHAAFAVAFYGALIYLLSYWGAFPRRPLMRWAIQGALFLLILVIGGSRVYLGVHWPSDVLGGYLFGGLCLLALMTVHSRLRRR